LRVEALAKRVSLQAIKIPNWNFGVFPRTVKNAFPKRRTGSELGLILETA
jgi:hypothetical protein